MRNNFLTFLTHWSSIFTLYFHLLALRILILIYTGSLPSQWQQLWLKVHTFLSPFLCTFSHGFLNSFHSSKVFVAFRTKTHLMSKVQLLGWTQSESMRVSDGCFWGRMVLIIDNMIFFTCINLPSLCSEHKQVARYALFFILYLWRVVLLPCYMISSCPANVSKLKIMCMLYNLSMT